MKGPNDVDFNPKTQGKVHPLQGKHENFLGYFTREIFNAMPYRSKRMVEDDPDNPYTNLHPALRPHAIFVEHNEALKKWEEIYVTGKPDVNKAAVKVAFAEKSRAVANRYLQKMFRMKLILTIFFGAISAALIPLWQMSEASAGSINAGFAFLVSGFLLCAYRTFESYQEMRRR